MIGLLSKVYRLLISPLIHMACGPGFGCRFLPTCGAYAQEALTLHGWGKGLRLTLFRLLRCHPFARAGYDPVPHAIGTPCSKPCFDPGR